MAHISTPRLLPLTILAMGGLLAMKSVTLVRAAAGGADSGTAAAVTPARAAPSVTPGATPGNGGAMAAASPQGAPQGTTQGPTKGTTQAAPAAPPAMPEPPVPTVSAGERTVLLELRRRRDELDAREATVTARETTLAAAELRINARVGELETLQHKLEDLEKAREQRDDASWQGLVKLYETMKPRDAATIFNDLDMPVLLGVMDRMKDSKAALVLAAMQPDKARDVTTKLAALRTKRAAVAQGN
jgi:flagellar motility protein MotE (MotC chaperone)